MSENRTLDATKRHIESAVTPEAAGWHIAVFLLWAAKRGLAATEHDAAQIEPDPTRYLTTRVGDKLWTADLTPAGGAFAVAHYADYLEELDDIADSNGLGHISELAAHPNGTQWALEVLDELLEDSDA